MKTGSKFVLMKQSYLILILVFFINCKKETNPIIANTKLISEIGKNFGEGKKIKIDTLQILKFKSQDLMVFYKTFDLETVWQSTESRKIVLDEILKSEIEGLNKSDYAFDKLSEYEKKIESLNDAELLDYDLLLTYNLQKYISQLSKGKLNPKSIYPDWDLKEKEIDVNTILFDAFENNTFTELIEKSRPKQIVYQELKNALKIINALPEDYSKPIAFSKKNKLKFNEANSLIPIIKKRLIYWNDLAKTDSITKIYDEKTQQAVKNFQERHGLIPDGVIGQGTINALNFNKSERKEQIIANMERLRWFPEDFGKHYTIVNIPDYSLNVVKDGDTIQTYKVIVGKKERRSPVFTSKLSTVVFNPTWTVPPTIIKEDLIPDATKNRGYFAKMHITIFDSKKRIVNPWSWIPEKANNYQYVQDPGTFNSLGMMKILFPNRFSVYLHDTNHKDGFSRSFRSLSSGCTRTEKPLELAEYVLNDSIRWNKEKILKTIKEAKTLNITIKQEILHYQLYFTAWSKKNHLVFRDDIYNLDADLYCRLRN